MVMRRLAMVWMMAVAALLAGCSGMMLKPERPEVTVTSIELLEPGLFEQRFRVGLRVQNPNNFDLPVEGVKLSLELNGKPFITAVSAKAVNVPRYGSAVMEVDAVSTLAGLLNQIGGVVSGSNSSVRYKLAGKVSLSNMMVDLPFERVGEIKLDLGQ